MGLNIEKLIRTTPTIPFAGPNNRFPELDKGN